MKTCKEILPDGKPCTNQTDEGQDYCPFHLANQITLPKQIFSVALPILGFAAFLIIKVIGGSKSK